MAKKKTPRKQPDNPLDLGGVRFELEEDPYALMRDFLETMPGNIKEIKETDHAPPPSRKSRQPKARPRRTTFVLDLHGRTLTQAQAESTTFIARLLGEQSGPFILKVITGRGLHSGAAGSVLVREIYHFIQATFRANIVKIDAPPAESTIDGLPLRGFFLVHFHKRSR